MNNRSLLIIGCLFVLPFGLQKVHSHPHLFLECTIILECENDTIRGFWLDWSFDKMFSAMILQDYDENGDGEFSTREIRTVYENAFINLEQHHFFTYVTKNGKRWSPETVENFTCFIRDEALVYRFFIPCSVKPGKDSSTFKITIFDETNFTSIEYSATPVRLSLLYPFSSTSLTRSPYRV